MHNRKAQLTVVVESLAYTLQLLHTWDGADVLQGCDAIHDDGERCDTRDAADAIDSFVEAFEAAVAVLRAEAIRLRSVKAMIESGRAVEFGDEVGETDE